MSMFIPSSKLPITFTCIILNCFKIKFICKYYDMFTCMVFRLPNLKKKLSENN